MTVTGEATCCQGQAAADPPAGWGQLGVEGLHRRHGTRRSKLRAEGFIDENTGVVLFLSPRLVLFMVD